MVAGCAGDGRVDYMASRLVVALASRWRSEHAAAQLSLVVWSVGAPMVGRSVGLYSITLNDGMGPMSISARLVSVCAHTHTHTQN